MDYGFAIVLCCLILCVTIYNIVKVIVKNKRR